MTSAPRCYPLARRRAAAHREAECWRTRRLVGIHINAEARLCSAAMNPAGPSGPPPSIRSYSSEVVKCLGDFSQLQKRSLSRSPRSLLAAAARNSGAVAATTQEVEREVRGHESQRSTRNNADKDC